MKHVATRVFLATLGVGFASATPADEVPDLYRQSYALGARGDYDGALRRMNEVASRGGTDCVPVCSHPGEAGPDCRAGCPPMAPRGPDCDGGRGGQ